VLEKGDGYAIGMIDYGQEHNLIWVTAIDDTGEIWCAPNHMVRLGKNWTMGRGENALIARDRQAAARHKDVAPSQDVDESVGMAYDETAARDA
jgi:hypothetical protein